MLIVFKGRASADVIMLEDNGKEMLRLLAKDPLEPKGVVTVAQLPAAIASLRAAIGSGQGRRAMPASAGAEPDSASMGQAPVAHAVQASADDTGPPVQLFQRALPLLELLERSAQKQVPVTWGV